MSKIKGLPQWFGILVVGALLSIVTASAVLANNSATPGAAQPSCPKGQAQLAQQSSPAPGQLVRRGVTGKVVSLSATPQASITVETQFGKVKIEVPTGFDMTTVKEGSRIAALLEKEPAPVIATPTPAQADTPFRVGKALKIKVIPAEATVTHQREVVVNQQGDTLEVADEDGNVNTLKVVGKGRVQVTTERDGKPQREVQEEQVSQSTDAILLVQCTGTDAKPQVHGIQNAQRVADRLEQLKAQAQQRSDALAAKVAHIQQQNAQRQQERLANTASHVPASVRGAVEQAHQKAQERQCSGQGKEKGCPKPQDKGKSQDQSGGRSEDRGQGKK